MDNNRHPEHKKAPQKKSFNSYKRSTVKQFSSTISILIMLPVFGLITLFMFFFPKSEKSEIENRNLAKFPEFSFGSYFSGEFTNGINTWYTDTVPFRDDFKNAGNSFKAGFGISTEDTVNVVGDVKKVTPAPSSNKTNSGNKSSSGKTGSNTPSAETSGSASASNSNGEASVSADEASSTNYREEEAEYTVENGVIVVFQDGHYRALELFGGGEGDKYVDALNSLRSQLDSKIKIYSMPAPLASEYYVPSNYTEYTANQKEFFNSVEERLDDGIISIDIDSVLEKHTDEDIYLRTDHHWSPLGAYYASQEFAKTAGVDFKDLSTYEAVTIKDFVGTMYAFSGGDINIKNDPEDFTYYIPDNYEKCKTDFYDTSFNFDYTGSFFKDVGDPQSNAYLTFFGGDEQIVKIRTNVKNGRKLVVIKDSYGNAEPGYYMGSFEEIYIVDMRYFNLNLVDFINEMDITDVLFTMVTYSVFGENAENLPVIISQAKGQEIVDHYKDN